jgi:23S rRNA (guanosine2251-2'-O)-methyltransferase
MQSEEWIVGFHAVLSLLDSESAIDRLLVQRGRRDQRISRIVELAKRRRVACDFVPRERLDRIAAGVPHNGCAARTAPISFVELDQLVADEGSCGRLVLLDSIDDPRNAGAVVRSAAAFEIDGLILAGHSAPPLAGALAKAAAGQLSRVPVARVRVAADALELLRSSGYWVFGADAGGEAVDRVTTVDRWVLCIGAEAKGLRAKTRSRVDEMIAIPMAPEVESLNLSVAAGILLFSLVRRGSGESAKTLGGKGKNGSFDPCAAE